MSTNINHRGTKFDNKKALILNNHPHSGEVAVCMGADKTNLGWAMKFKSTETQIEFYVWSGNDIQWIN